MLDQLLKKENLLIIVAVACVAIWYYRKELSNNTFAQETINYLPIAGGLAFGFNTLIQLTK